MPDIHCPIEALKRVAKMNDLNLMSATGACATSGRNVFIGGTGFTATLGAPQPGDYCELQLRSITSGAVVITTAEGVTLDGTNNTATLAQAGDQAALVYKSPTEWSFVFNTGVAVSDV